MMITEQQTTSLVKLLERLAAERYYGDLVFAFQGGEITLIRENRTYKPQELINRGDRKNCESSTTK